MCCAHLVCNNPSQHTHICLAIQDQYFSEMECSLSSYMARMSHFCRQWRLKPSASKTKLDEDCRQAEEPKQLADEASRFHLRRQRQHSAVICSDALLFSSRVLLVTLCSHKSGRCTVELYHASHLWYPPFYTSPMASSALQH